MAALRLCHAAGCYAAIAPPATRCARHTRSAASRTAALGYRRQHWTQLRRAVLARSGERCELHVDERCTGTATTVHLAPYLDGAHDRATLEDCTAACRHCHAVTDGRRTPIDGRIAAR